MIATVDREKKQKTKFAGDQTGGAGSCAVAEDRGQFPVALGTLLHRLHE